MRLRGEGIGAGTAIGAAAVVRIMSGVPLPPEIPPRVLVERAGGRNSELPDVIVVAEEFRNALAISGAISWANVVGVAAERSETNSLPCPFPAVVGLSNLLESVEDDMLLLLDAAAGVLLADPDAFHIAEYQAETEHLAPRRRLFIADTHLPTETLDGYTIQISAEIKTLDEIPTAIDYGADFLYIPAPTELSAGSNDAAAQCAYQMEIVKANDSKPFFVEYDYDSSVAPLLEAAAISDYSLVITPSDAAGGGVVEFQTHIRETYDTLRETKRVVLPPIALKLLTNSHTNFEALMTSEVEVLILRFPLFSMSPDEDLADLIKSVKASARASSITDAMQWRSTHFHADSLSREKARFDAQISELVGAGISGMIVPVDEIMEVKAAIRELRFKECREAILYKFGLEEYDAE